MTKSSYSPCVFLATLGLIFLDPRWGPALETVTIGQDGELDWRGEGAAPIEVVDARHRSPRNPNELLVGNVPGNLIEFQSADFANSILLLRLEEGEDIASGTMDRGGDIQAPNVFSLGEGYGFAGGFSRANLRLILQELLSNEEGGESEAFVRRTPNAFGILVILDLGGRFWVDRIRFYPRNTVQSSPSTPFQENFLRAFELFSNDGVNLTGEGNPIWQPLLVERDNKNPVVVVDLETPRIIQKIRLRSITDLGWEIDEFEVFGRSFLTTGRYISDIFDAEQPAVWTNLRWSEETVGNSLFSSLEIRTRTGTDPSPFLFTRKLKGKRDAEEVPLALNSLTEKMDLAEYQSLPQIDDEGREWEPGAVQDDLVNWSPFSSTLAASAANGPGVPITSPSPRRYFQFQVVFKSNALEAARVLKSASFDFLTPPLADSLKGEIFPREVDLSTTFSFTYAVRAVLQTPGLRGFDTMEVPTRVRVESIEAVELRDENEQLIAEQTFTDLEGSTAANGFQIVSVTDDKFTVRFPLVRKNNTRVQIRFKTEVLTYSTDFAALVWLASEPEAFQAVVPGNAAYLGEGDDPDFSGTTVLSPVVLREGRLLDNVELAPNPFTPNGDGINDQLFVRYKLLSLSVPRPVNISVYDLSGRLVRVVHDGPERSGRYQDKTWDGRNDQDQLGAPGFYIVRIAVAGDARNAEQSRVVVLVY